jgi:hypothetical protein
MDGIRRALSTLRWTEFGGRCQGPPRGATAPDRQGPYGERRLKRKGTVRVPSGSDGALMSGPLWGATVRRALSGSPSGSDGARPSGSLRGATAEAQGYCRGPLGERRCPTVRVPLGERRFEGYCQGPFRERRCRTVRVPPGSDGSKGTVRVPAGSDRTAAAAEGLRCPRHSNAAPPD